MNDMIAETMEMALRSHRAGNLQLAEQLYGRVLQADRHHADAIHSLGVLAYQTGRSEQAVALISKAIALKPTQASYHSNLGLVHESLGHDEEAVFHFREALKIDAHHPAAHSNLAKALLNKGDLEQAVTHCRQALLGHPNSPETLTTLGTALERQGHLKEAMTHWQEALRLNPNLAHAHYNLGTALEREGQFDEAIHCYREALRNDPSLGDAWNNLGASLVRQHKFDEGVDCYRQALRLKPLDADIHHNLGTAFERQDRFDEAIPCFREALRLKPDFAESCNSLGSILALQVNLREAMSLLDKAIELEPANALARWNRSLLLLLTGDFERGWKEYEWRSAKPGIVQHQFAQPRWDGTPLDGRSILLYADQGLGDTIQFIRYASLMRERGGKVVVECQPALVRLLASASGIDCVVAIGSDPPPFDVQASLLNLPGIFHTTVATIPGDIPYLHADPTLQAYWRGKSGVRSPVSGVRGLNSEVRGQRSKIKGPSADTGHRTPDSGHFLGTPDSGQAFRIGIAWQGSPAFRHDRRRSIPLAQFARLAEIGGVQLISLQKGYGVEQLSVASCQLSERQIVDLGMRFDEDNGQFMDTAAVMTNIDLVISSDTAVPHLAGALGVPVWVAVSHMPDWRWLLERKDSPWYPTLRLFRQSRAGDWDGVFERIAAELSRVVDQARLLQFAQ
jgi:tetratricopeptide (TPR) repeat protein